MIATRRGPARATPPVCYASHKDAQIRKDGSPAWRIITGVLPGPPDLARRMLDAWLASTEAALRATFEAQQVALDAGLSVVEAAAGPQAGAMRQWAEGVRAVHRAALEVFLTSLRAAWSATPPSGGSLAERPEQAAPPAEGYCLRCRTRRPMRDVQPAKLAGGRSTLQGICTVCGARMTRIIKVS
jgi:hypothetical protein